MDYLYRPVSYTPSRTAVDADGTGAAGHGPRRPRLPQLDRHPGLRGGLPHLPQRPEPHLPADRDRRSCGATSSTAHLPADTRRVTPAERAGPDARPLRRHPPPVPDLRRARGSRSSRPRPRRRSRTCTTSATSCPTCGAPWTRSVDACRSRGPRRSRWRAGSSRADGEPDSDLVRIAFSAEGPPYLELIEVVPRPGSIFAEPAGGGLHHVGFYAERWRDEVARLTGEGMELERTGRRRRLRPRSPPSASASRS